MYKSHERFAPLDGLRGVAVLAVLACHTAGVPAAGRVGVDLFFVLSGLLITDIIAKGYGSGGSFFANFYRRRLLRLYPALFGACALLIVIAVMFPWFEQRPVASVVSALLMVSNYTQAAGLGFPTAFGHTWSLATEWQFYLLWPFAYVALRRRLDDEKRLIPILLGAAALVWISRYLSDGTVWQWRALDARADGLLYGGILSILIRHWPQVKLPGWVCSVSVGVFTLMAFLPFQQELYLSNALSAVIVLGVVSASVPIINRALSAPWLTYTGRISYGLYLYHFPIAAVCYVWGMHPLLNLGVTAILSIPLAVMSWRYVEEPILQMRRIQAAKACPAPTPG